MPPSSGDLRPAFSERYLREIPADHLRVVREIFADHVRAYLSAGARWAYLDARDPSPSIDAAFSDPPMGAEFLPRLGEQAEELYTVALYWPGTHAQFLREGKWSTVEERGTPVHTDASRAFLKAQRGRWQ